MSFFAKIWPLTWPNEVKYWPRTKILWLIARSGWGASTGFYREALVQSGTDRQGGGLYQHPHLDRPRYEKSDRARVNVYVEIGKCLVREMQIIFSECLYQWRNHGSQRGYLTPEMSRAVHSEMNFFVFVWFACCKTFQKGSAPQWCRCRVVFRQYLPLCSTHVYWLEHIIAVHNDGYVSRCEINK